MTEQLPRFDLGSFRREAVEQNNFELDKFFKVIYFLLLSLVCIFVPFFFFFCYMDLAVTGKTSSLLISCLTPQH